MQEYELKILEQYDLEVKSTRKMRGAFFCDTKQGAFLLKEAGISDKRAAALFRLGEQLKDGGYERTDRILPNRNGELVSVSEDGGRYLVKHWFAGRECEIRRSRELFLAVKNLAGLHLLMVMPAAAEACAPAGIPAAAEAGSRAGMSAATEAAAAAAGGAPLRRIYESRNRELRKVRRFIRSRSGRDEFELLFLKEFEEQYAWAQAAVRALAETDYERLYAESMMAGQLIHGEYNYHNILITGGGIATTGFEHFRQQIQMEDLYYFLRKVMEKHGWNVRLCDCMLNAYSAVRPVGSLEMEYLKVRLVYPEKFWKLTSAYYRSNKAWLSVKNVEKFQTVIRQTGEKRKLLEEIFAFTR